MSHCNIRVLSISDDGSVRSSRELILRKDGYEIVSVSSDDVLGVSEIRSFDVAVMCYSIKQDRAMAIVDRLRRYNPAIRVLRVNPRIYTLDPFYDVDSEVLAGPDALLKAVKALLDRNSLTIAGHVEPMGRDEYCGPYAFSWTKARAS